MSADFWAGYLSGAIGILIGNPLDIIKVQRQAGMNLVARRFCPSDLSKLKSLARGSAAPILGYGGLNALLFVSYNRTISVLDPSVYDSAKLSHVRLSDIWLAGAVGGLASWIVSAPSELIKCRTQLSANPKASSLYVLKDAWRDQGFRGLYKGGAVTSVRDAVGYGFYFWSYEITKRWLKSRRKSEESTSMEVLLSGGLAGTVTWTSIYPLDVLKTRIQAQPEMFGAMEASPSQKVSTSYRRISAITVARRAFRADGMGIFFRGLGVCNVRAFIVNAVQWFTYEKVLTMLNVDEIERSRD